MTPVRSGPLAGIRVLDLTRVLAGPFCTMMLADMGADVIKIEMPGEGDDTRAWGPPFINGESVYYLAANRNKRSVAINLKDPDGKEIVRRLAARSDIVVENFRPGTMESLGLGYDVLKAINPRIIYTAVSGFGRTGPRSREPGYDLLIQGMGGLMGITGEEGGPPVKVGVSIADIGAGMWAAFGTLAALWGRERTGQGQLVDVSLLDGQVAWLTFMAGIYFATGENPPKLGSAHPTIVPYQAFAGSDDRYFILACGNDNFWHRLSPLLPPEVAADPRFATNPGRVEHRHELVEKLADWFRTQPVSYWLAEIQKVGVPCGPINLMSDVFSEPQVLARDMVVELEHPVAGHIRLPGIPVKLSATPGEVWGPPPTLGQHTDDVLAELGYDPAAIARLRERNVVQ